LGDAAEGQRRLLGSGTAAGAGWGQGAGRRGHFLLCLPGEGREYFFAGWRSTTPSSSAGGVLDSNHLQFGPTTVAAIYKEGGRLAIFQALSSCAKSRPLSHQRQCG